MRITNGRRYTEDGEEFYSTLHLIISSVTVVKKNPERSRIRSLREGFHVLSATTEVDSKKEAQAQVVAYLKHLSDLIPTIPVMADKAVAPKQRCVPLSSKIAW